MKPTKGEGLWIRLSQQEKDDIEKEAKATGFNMSEIARQRLFSDPIKLLDNRIAILERRSLTTLALLNFIAERTEELFSEEYKIKGKKKKERIEELKALVIKGEALLEDKEADSVSSFF